MIAFSYSRAERESEALAAGAAGARFIAGGTTLVDLMREGVERPLHLLDINALPLHEIRATPSGLAIGALARMSDVAAHPVVAREYPLIAEALLEGASPQLRNMASIGGNLLQRVRCPYFRDTTARCNKRAPASGCASIEGWHRNQAIFGTSASCIATHPSDLAVALVALDATLHVHAARGERSLAVEDLFRLPGDHPELEHDLQSGELIAQIEVPAAPHTRRSHYLKVRDRASYEFAIVSAAVALEVEGGVIRAARLAAGGVGTVPWRLRASEAELVGQPPGDDAWRRAADRAVQGARPLPQNGFKIELLRRALVRALGSAVQAG